MLFVFPLDSPDKNIKKKTFVNWFPSYDLRNCLLCLKDYVTTEKSFISFIDLALFILG